MSSIDDTMSIVPPSIRRIVPSIIGPAIAGHEGDDVAVPAGVS
ncbi:hypothetical protein [Mycolicibacterium tusciae]|nr:hypothetical protein [Mycolicibacterium tusciae]